MMRRQRIGPAAMITVTFVDILQRHDRGATLSAAPHTLLVPRVEARDSQRKETANALA